MERRSIRIIFFKQKAAYEMRMSDWSSDVCSSDLGRSVAVKVLRPGVEDEFARAIETYEWAAAQVEALGGEAARLRPRLVIAMFRQWTARELDLRREAASASELAESLQAELGFTVPAIDWTRTSRRVMTLEWIDGIKLTDRDALVAAGHDLKRL